ncbi:IclR family transcriptional regulator [Metabacillus litoralis]|uniref:IclR family transcriptional regulator n=1 Tax=Metabacillus litoralis TaxID=152268 RepID=UPI0020406C17|nr:IclR family transcriptional regulator [Metabacillus litoralis]MCM3653545.1 IclR family transcriptional regulator [Metabacillus litoralis]
MSKYEASTLKKGLQILELLKINRSLTLREIYEMLGLTKTTAFRLVNTLEDMDYIQKNGKYFELNSGMFLSTSERKSSIDWTTLQSPYRLGVSVGENVHIGTLDGMELVMQQMIKPPFKEPFHQEIGNRSPAHQSAIGKVILAHLNPNEQKDLFSHLSLTQATEHTFVDPELFFHHLNVIKKQGFAIDDEERFLGVRCIAAPVFRDKQIIAAVAIAGPSESMKRSILRSLTRKMIDGSKEITNEIS